MVSALTSTAAGKDSTQDYDEIGHSNHAKKILEKYVIGLWEVSRTSGHSALCKRCLPLTGRARVGVLPRLTSSKACMPLAMPLASMLRPWCRSIGITALASGSSLVTASGIRALRQI